VSAWIFVKVSTPICRCASSVGAVFCVNVSTPICRWCIAGGRMDFRNSVHPHLSVVYRRWAPILRKCVPPPLFVGCASSVGVHATISCYSICMLMWPRTWVSGYAVLLFHVNVQKRRKRQTPGGAGVCSPRRTAPPCGNWVLGGFSSGLCLGLSAAVAVYVQFKRGRRCVVLNSMSSTHLVLGGVRCLCQGQPAMVAP
jgi:hypothetical protein